MLLVAGASEEVVFEPHQCHVQEVMEIAIEEDMEDMEDIEEEVLDSLLSFQSSDLAGAAFSDS